MSITRTIAGRPLKAVGLGCMNVSHAYGHPLSKEDGAKLLSRALDLGYDHLDSARLYGLGKNEELIGETLKGRRKDFFLASKMGIIIDGDARRIDCRPEVIRSEVEKSLKLLQTDCIDLYYLHRFDKNVPIEDSVGALGDLVKEGKIGGVGISEMSEATLRRAHAATPIAALQNEYSPWTRNVELGTLDACKELGVALVAFSPVARGALAGELRDPATLPQGDLRLGHPRFNAENWAKNLVLIDQFNALATEAGVTPAQLSLNWVLSRGDHVHVIPGTTSVPHLEENLAALDVTISDDILARVGEIINQQTVSGHRYPEGMRKTIDTEEFPETV
ncbi:MAG: aldo/keto reductase [Sphingobium sp.]|nr:aldo/keto reductase [Sphingobium sp.]